MFRNLILDWSGTLCDDLPPVLETVNRILIHFGAESLDREGFLEAFRLPFGDFYEGRISGVSPDELESRYQEFFPEASSSAEAIPHAREFVELMRATGRRCFILSAVTPAHFHEQAEQVGLSGKFDALYLGVRDKRRVIRQLLEDHALDPGETCFVGDMVHDVEAAREGGITAVAVLTGYDSAGKLAPSAPDLMVPDLDRLGAWFLRQEPFRRMPVATVGALIRDSEGRVLMVRTHKWSDRWGIPGGKVERGETCEEALRREIREETALELDEIRFVLCQDCIEPPEFERSAHFLLLNYTARCRPPADVVLNDEAEEFRWCVMEEAAALELNEPTRILLDAVRQGA